MPCIPFTTSTGVTGMVCTRPRKAATKPPPSLADLEAACRSAGQAGWTRAEVAQQLRNAGAMWEGGKLLDVPEGQRKSLLSVLQHHPTWIKESVAFCAGLPSAGLNYQELASGCTAMGWPRPSMMTSDSRARLLEVLNDKESPLWAEILERRTHVSESSSRKKADSTVVSSSRSGTDPSKT